MARTFATKTPGVFPEPDAEGGSAEMTLQPAPDIAAMIEEGIRKGVAAALAGNARAVAAATPDNLPDQSEIKADEITNMVLTKQGYVVPAKYGSFAADIVQH